MTKKMDVDPTKWVCGKPDTSVIVDGKPYDILQEEAQEAKQAQKDGHKTGTIWDYYCESVLGPGGEFEHVAQGRPSKHEAGALYEGRWEIEAHGICEHVRRTCRALAESGVPVHLRSPLQSLVSGVRSTDRHLRQELAPLLMPSFGKYAVQIHHLEPGEGVLPVLVTHQNMPKEALEGVNKRRIVYCVWERTGLIIEDVDALNSVGMVWTASYRNKQMLKDSGVKTRIEVVPVPHWPDDPLLKLRGRPRRRGVPRFYTIAKWEPRKDNHAVVGAFMGEFRPGEAQLIMKTTAFGPKAPPYPSSLHSSVSRWLNDNIVQANGWTLEQVNRNIFLNDYDMPRSAIVKLHETGDIYVSLSHGEGWDLPAYDAKLAGNLLVYTPSGGPQMFAATEDFMVEPRDEEIPCHLFYHWPGTWLDYDICEARKQLRKAWEVVRGGAGETTLPSGFDAQTVGGMMRQYIEELIGGKRW